MKTRLAIWLGLELLVAVVLDGGSCLLRRDEMRAFKAWHDSPTAQNRVELDRQRSITLRYHIVFVGILWGGMAVVTIPIIVAVFRHGSRREMAA